MENSVYKLEEFIDKKHIIKDGLFDITAPADAATGNKILCYAITKEYIDLANANSHVSCVITNAKFADSVQGKALVVHDEPIILFGQIVNKLIENGVFEPSMNYGISDSASIDPTAIVSKKCRIGNNVSIGRHSIVEDYTIIEDDVVIGDNVVIGCPGFFFRRAKSGELVKFLHAGGVHLHKNVEVMTGSIVQRAQKSRFTIVGEGTKISVNVNIGHDAVIGKHNQITGNVQIAGNTTMGDACWIGTSVTISDGVKIGNNAEIKIGSVVVKNVKDNEVVSGNFAILHSKNLKNYIKAQR